MWRPWRAASLRPGGGGGARANQAHACEHEHVVGNIGAPPKQSPHASIGMVVVINTIKNPKFTPKKPNLDSYRKEIQGSDKRGVNAMSISEITGIPRPTVVRKIKYLVDKKFLHINDKKLITYNAKDSAFVTTKGMVNKNVLSLSHFIYKVFNQIRIINN